MSTPSPQDPYRLATSPEQSPVRTYLRNLPSPGSRQTMAFHLKAIARTFTGGASSDYDALPWDRLGSASVHDLIEHGRRQGLSPATLKVRLTAIRGVLRIYYNRELISHRRYHDVRDVRIERSTPPPAGRYLSPYEMNRLMGTCDSTLALDRRDAALIHVLAAYGLRRAEVVSIRYEDIDAVSRTVRITGKGNRQRDVFFSHASTVVLTSWLSVRGLEPGPLFCRVRKNGAPDLRKPLSPNAVYQVLRARAAQAGIQPVSPHDLRRTCITHKLDRGVDIATIADIVGHNDLNTTTRYDRRGMRAQREASVHDDTPHPVLAREHYTVDPFRLFSPKEIP